MGPAGRRSRARGRALISLPTVRRRSSGGRTCAHAHMRSRSRSRGGIASAVAYFPRASRLRHYRPKCRRLPLRQFCWMCRKSRQEIGQRTPARTSSSVTMRPHGNGARPRRQQDRRTHTHTSARTAAQDHEHAHEHAHSHTRATATATGTSGRKREHATARARPRDRDGRPKKVCHTPGAKPCGSPYDTSSSPPCAQKALCAKPLRERPLRARRNSARKKVCLDPAPLSAEGWCGACADAWQVRARMRAYAGSAGRGRRVCVCGVCEGMRGRRAHLVGFFHVLPFSLLKGSCTMEGTWQRCDQS